MRAANPRRREPRNQEMSPLSLRRKFMPRVAITKPRAAHPPPAKAAAEAQAPHLNHTNRAENQATATTTTHRSPRLTTFKPGFEQETEEQLAAAFKRPVRKFKEDFPFYPWLPPQPIVNFYLNLKARPTIVHLVVVVVYY